MEFKEFQYLARTTDQNPQVSSASDRESGKPQAHEIIPLLGLVGEVGGLLSEYKKMLRDGAMYELFPGQVAEELGDILWYVSTVASKFDLDLNKIAEDTLAKTGDRWHKPGAPREPYDAKCPQEQQLPRKFSYVFRHEKVDESEKLVMVDAITGQRVGSALTDNAYEDDGYRYHDVMHLAFVAHFGWSPVFRQLLRDAKPNRLIDRRDPPAVHSAEDSGRGQVIDEAIVAAAYVYAADHNFLKGAKVIDWQVLRHIKQMTANLEVKDRTAWEWNATLVDGFKIWRKLMDHKGGTVSGSLETGVLSFSPPV